MMRSRIRIGQATTCLMLEEPIVRSGLRMSSINVRNNAGVSENMRFLPSRTFVRRMVAALWIAVYLWLLAHTLALTNGSQHVFVTAEYIQPTSFLPLSIQLTAF